MIPWYAGNIFNIQLFRQNGCKIISKLRWQILNLCALWNHTVNRQQLQGDNQKIVALAKYIRCRAVNLVSAKKVIKGYIHIFIWRVNSENCAQNTALRLLIVIFNQSVPCTVTECLFIIIPDPYCHRSLTPVECPKLVLLSWMTFRVVLKLSTKAVDIFSTFKLAFLYTLNFSIASLSSCSAFPLNISLCWIIIAVWWQCPFCSEMLLDIQSDHPCCDW